MLRSVFFKDDNLQTHFVAFRQIAQFFGQKISDRRDDREKESIARAVSTREKSKPSHRRSSQQWRHERTPSAKM
jgi:hypothetical protein